MTLPPEYTGAWRRESIALGGAPASEPQQVWWLQTPSHFADLRLPLVPHAGAESFSGVTTLSPGPRLAWHRDLDLHHEATDVVDSANAPPADSGEVSWQDGALIEDGVATVFGAPVRYREVWRRMPGSAGPCLSLRPSSGQGRLVIVGDYALATLIRPEPGARPVSAAWHRASGAWEAAGCWPLPRPGSPPALPRVLAVLNRSAGRLTADWQTPDMTIDLWWPRLRAQTQLWLMANNGDVVPESLLAEIEAAGGPARSDPWWTRPEGSADRCMPDEAIDWIEETANGEGTAG